MGSEWKSCRLGDVVQIKTGNPFKSKDYSDASGAVRLLRGDNIVQGTLRWENAKGWHPSRVDEVSDYLLRTGDVVLAMDRPWIEAGLKYAAITPNDTPCLLVQRVACLRSKADLDQAYLHYLIGSPDFTNYVLGIQTGTAVPHISSGQIQAFSFLLPPLEHQKEAGSILRSLDDKIALLRETNATLEAIAQALFKSWFVDFDPVRAKAEGRDPEGVPPEVADLFPSEFEESTLGEIPKGWRVQQLGLHMDVLETGRRPKGGVGDLQEGVPSIGAESIIRVGQFDYAKTKFVSRDFFQSMKTGKLESRDVLLYKDGGKPGIFLPRVSMFGDGFPFEVCGINEHVFRIRTRETLSQPFLYFWLWSDIAMHELKHRGGKAAIPGINQSDVREVPVVVPNKPVLDHFSKIADTLITKILANSNQIQSLSNLRDTLLPRLMSGKLLTPSTMEVPV